MKRSCTTSTLPLDGEETLATLGRRIRLFRRALGLTQSDLAAKAGIGLSTVVAIEKGSPTVQIGFWICALWALDLLDHFKALTDLGRNEKFAAILEAQYV